MAGSARYCPSWDTRPFNLGREGLGYRAIDAHDTDGRVDSRAEAGEAAFDLSEFWLDDETRDQRCIHRFLQFCGSLADPLRQFMVRNFCAGGAEFVRAA